MGRVARAVAAGVPIYVSQVGNRRLDVFFSDDDRRRYLSWLSQYSQQYEFEVLAYCLMPNHIHIVGIPQSSTGLAKTMKLTHMRHSQSVNRENGWNGHLWQGRFYSTMLDESHLRAAILFVEQNPVRTGIVSRAEEYPWSSAPCHCGLREDLVVSGDSAWGGRVEGWPSLLAKPLEAECADELRNCASTGKPCGSEEFVALVSEQVGRSLKRRPRGRPRLIREEIGD